MAFRWLHLSDFHTGKDGYGEDELFKQLIGHVEKTCSEGFIPHVVFITGDLAQAGKPEQYERFKAEFLEPRRECLGSFGEGGWTGRFYAVPGNHDVNRAADFATRDGIVAEGGKTMFRPDQKGAELRARIMARFAGYCGIDSFFSGTPWLGTDNAFFVDTLTIDGRTIGIAGINTAWLAEDENDESRLRAGHDIARKALESLADVDQKILLGHHPLDWLIAEDREPLMKVLGDHHAVYLHGHLHKAKARTQFFRTAEHLTIRTGAGFQAHGDDIWVNGVLWGEIDWHNNSVRVQAREYSNVDGWTYAAQRFNPDDADPAGKSWFRFPLPGRQITQVPVEVGGAQGLAEAAVHFQALAADDANPEAPAGWTWVDKAWLDQQRTPLSQEELLAFFDGLTPRWRHALSPAIPRRGAVAKAATLLRDAAAQPSKPRVVFIEGPGGEGKSTILYQTVAELLDEDASWRVLWRDNDIKDIAGDFAAKLAGATAPILIVTDEADNIAASLLAFVEAARTADLDKLHLLIAARDTDWRAARPDQPKWFELTDYQRLPIRGINDADAKLFYDAWMAAGHAGLGRLASMTRENALKRLLQTAHDKETDRSEGALLAAMIELRFGEGFRDHVRKLLGRLGTREAPGGTLRDAYMYIAAMHAENLLFLSKPVLARTLGCTEPELRAKVTIPLADEAAAAMQGNYVLTRHRVIAETATRLLKDELPEFDYASLFSDLARLASEHFLFNRSTPDIRDWCFSITKHFSRRNEHEIATNVADALVTSQPSNVHLLVGKARTLRAADRAAVAVELFREAPPEVERNRVFYYEWGTAAGNAGDQALSAWLDAISLSNWERLPNLNDEDVKMALAGLGVAFGELFDKTADKLYLRARGAVGQLGLRLKGADQKRALGYFKRYKSEAAAEGIGELSPDAALDAVWQAIVGAYETYPGRYDLIDDGLPIPREDFALANLHSFLRARPEQK